MPPLTPDAWDITPTCIPWHQWGKASSRTVRVKGKSWWWERHRASHFALAKDFRGMLFRSLELQEQRAGGQLPGLYSHDVDLRGTYDVSGIIHGIESERCASIRRRSGVGACHGLPGDKRPGGVDVKIS